jgi:hypothetical protein
MWKLLGATRRSQAPSRDPLESLLEIRIKWVHLGLVVRVLEKDVICGKGGGGGGEAGGVAMQ